MNKSVFVEKLKKVTKENLDIDLTDIEAEQLFFISDKLIETNKVMNLTAISEENDVILKHLVDSMLISRYIKPKSKIIDVGSGAGFPALPLAILRKDIEIYALDSTEKKVNYINDTAKELGLINLKAIFGRAEELSNEEEYREMFDYGTARAVASLPILSELVLPFVKIGGNMIAMKGPDAENEVKNAKNAVNILAGSNSFNNMKIDKYVLQDGNASETRYIINIMKESKTPPNYPRIYSKIKKSPL